MRNNVIVLGLFMLFSMNIFAQQKAAKISFVKEGYQLGTIKEVDGAVDCNFEFTNIGAEDLTITNVKPDYGLTAYEWPKTAIKPGEKGIIKAKYNPQRMSGRFNKKMTVTSNSGTNILRVTGNIIPKPKSIADQYRQQMDNGNLRLKKNFFSLNKVKNTQIKKDSTDIINNGEADLKLSFKNVPTYMTVKAVPSVLKPKQKGKIYITYDASKVVDGNGKQIWGAQNRRINVIINDKLDGRANYMTVRATIEEDFSTWTPEQLAAAPSIKFDVMEYDFGTVKQGEVVKHEFKFTNTGKNDLEIRKVKGSWGCTAVSKTDQAVKKGETSVISVSFNTRGKRNKQHKTITVTTNDPKHQVVILKMVGEVVVPTTTPTTNGTKPANAAKPANNKVSH